MQAKTIFIQNDSGYANFADRCYDELTKWGRFKVVATPKAADLILRISSTVQSSGYTAESRSRTDDDRTTTHTDISENRAGFTRIEIITPNSPAAIWTDVRPWGGGGLLGFKSATRVVIQELRKRIEEQEAEAKKR